jgi:hypothetical protein
LWFARRSRWQIVSSLPSLGKTHEGCVFSAALQKKFGLVARRAVKWFKMKELCGVRTSQEIFPWVRIVFLPVVRVFPGGG